MKIKLNIDEARDAIRQFRDDRKKNKEEAEDLSKKQPELLDLIKMLDPDHRGIVVDDTDNKSGVAYYQQNAASEFWDVEGIMHYLRNTKEGKGHWMAVTSRIFDAQKWEAEIANGNIDKKVARKFKKMNTPPKPFIRFGGPDKERGSI